MPRRFINLIQLRERRNKCFVLVIEFHKVRAVLIKENGFFTSSTREVVAITSPPLYKDEMKEREGGLYNSRKVEAWLELKCKTFGRGLFFGEEYAWLNITTL